MKLVDAYAEPEAVSVLYQLLAERPPQAWVTHATMPTIEEHKRFIAARPFLYWFLIDEYERNYVGSLECTDRNEIGISILHSHRHYGHGTNALWIFLRSHTPLPAVPAIRNGHWLANVAIGNTISTKFWRKQGFKPLQYTMVRA